MLDITAISKTFHPGTPNARQDLRQLDQSIPVNVGGIDIVAADSGDSTFRLARGNIPENAVLKRKHIGHHLIELLAGFLLTAILSYILESRAGAVHAQDWEFYATVVCLYLIFAFPCFVWRYFWNERNRE